jgi:hypothetical protein
MPAVAETGGSAESTQFGTERGMLHITNGDSAGGSLIVSCLPGEVLAWADVLYEGRYQYASGPAESRH